jgi:hypothetical protein
LRLERKRVGLVLAQETVDVIAAGSDRHLGARDRDRKPCVVFRAARRADDVARFDLRPSPRDGFLLVPVGVRLHAPLLHQDPAVVLAGVERLAAEVAFHE